MFNSKNQPKGKLITETTKFITHYATILPELQPYQADYDMKSSEYKRYLVKITSLKELSSLLVPLGNMRGVYYRPELPIREDVEINTKYKDEVQLQDIPLTQVYEELQKDRYKSSFELTIDFQFNLSSGTGYFYVFDTTTEVVKETPITPSQFIKEFEELKGHMTGLSLLLIKVFNPSSKGLDIGDEQQPIKLQSLYKNLPCEVLNQYIKEVKGQGYLQVENADYDTDFYDTNKTDFRWINLDLEKYSLHNKRAIKGLYTEVKVNRTTTTQD